MSLLSIVTPVYNRAKLLERCFQSLLRQSCGDFEWIVVDDGSSDDPGAVLDRLTRQASFPTQFVRKENGGKHTALNAAHPYIHGSYVLILDSDDMLTEDAVEVECNLVVLYGHSVVEIAKNVQSCVTNAIESMTGLKVRFVDVNIVGISMSKA